MVVYRFDFRHGGEIIRHARHQFRDDLDALDAAERLAGDFEVSIWCGNRMVARVKPHNAPSTHRDDIPG